MEEKVFAKGSVIFREGDLGNSFFQILCGTAGVYSHYGEADERKLTDMKPGQYFGEMAVIEAWPRSSTIVAEDELHVIEISEKELNNYFAEQPDRILALMKQLGKRIRELTADYDEVMAYMNDKSSIQPEKKSGFLAKLKHFLASNSTADINEPTEEEVLAAAELEKKPIIPVDMDEKLLTEEERKVVEEFAEKKTSLICLKILFFSTIPMEIPPRF